MAVDCTEKENTGLRGKKQWNFPKIKKLMELVVFSLIIL